MTYPPCDEEQSGLLSPNPHLSPPPAMPSESRRGQEAPSRAVPFTARRKTVRLSRGSSPHNRRPSRVGGGKSCGTTGHSPATKPRRRRLFPGHLSARHNTAAFQRPRSMPSLSPLEPRLLRAAARGEASAPLQAPQGLRATTGEEPGTLFPSRSGITEQRSRVWPRRHRYGIAWCEVPTKEEGIGFFDKTPRWWEDRLEMGR